MIAFSTAFKMMLAASIAFSIYYYFDLPEGFWSVVTIAAVTQVGFANTAIKGLLRVLGTIVGALVGYGFALMVQGNLIIALCLFFGFILLTSFIAVQKTAFTYAPLVAGVTMVIVLSSSLLTNKLFATAVYRTLEVLLGVVILFIINLIMKLIIQKYKIIDSSLVKTTKLELNEFNKIIFSRQYFSAALKIALAALFTFSMWIFLKQPQGYWATVSCLIVMEESIHATHLRASLLFAGNLLAAVIGGVGALLIGNNAMAVLALLAICFFGFGYVIGVRGKYSLLGNLAGVALAIMLLKNPGTVSTLYVILARFLNVMFGIIVALSVIHFLSSKRTVNNS